MKVTQALCKQHIGRAIKYKWYIAREKIKLNNYVEDLITPLGIKVQDPLDVIQPKKVDFTPMQFDPPIGKKEEVFDINHPNWKDKICFTYKNHNVLQEGTAQAQLLTKTIWVEDELPIRIKNLNTDISERTDNLVKRIICTSTIFDAHQEKLPRIIDPERTWYIFPRAYGITDLRKVRNLSKKLLQLCECLSPQDIVKNRFLVHNGITSLYIEKGADLLNFALTMDLMVTSTKLLTPPKNDDVELNQNFPSIYPLYPTISLEKTNFYNIEDLYPINISFPGSNVHTIFVYHNPEEVKNLTELPVREDQIHARSMIKSFTAAAVCARQKFGAHIKELPEPVTVQCIQSDGKNFHFSVFQLNTLDITSIEGIKNYWWSEPTVQLYEKAGYFEGKSTLEGYNPDIFKKIFAFYIND